MSWPRLLSFFSRLGPLVRPGWVDPRSAAVFRMAAGLLFLAEHVYKAQFFDFFYRLPVEAPVSSVASLSLYALFPQQALVWWSIAAALAICVALGLGTRLAAVGLLYFSWSAIAVHSPTLNGGATVSQINLFFVLALPVSAVWSVDAAWAAARGRQPVRSASFSLGGLALLFQVGLMYLYNALNKSGPMWDSGQVLPFLIRDGFMLRSDLLPALSAVPETIWVTMTHAVWWLELLVLPLLLIPSLWVRRLTLVFLAALHLGFVSMLTIGFFPLWCICWLIPLWPLRSLRPWAAQADASQAGAISAWSTWSRQLPLVRLSAADYPQLLPALQFSRLKGTSSAVRPRFFDARLARPISGVRWWMAEILSQLAARVPCSPRVDLQRFVAPAVGSLALAFVATAPFVEADTLPAPLLRLMSNLNMTQSWGFFSPQPSEMSGHYQLRARLRSGEEVDLWRWWVSGDWQLSSQPRPQDFAVGSGRWGAEYRRKILQHVHFTQETDALDPLVQRLCAQWNAGAQTLDSQLHAVDRRAAPSPVEVVQLEFVPYRDAPRRELWSTPCLDTPLPASALD